ncbi:outer membrane protein with beta-barrel domain [Elizabethkingia sp. YR214]|uniref:outer membrane beta-barrel protein n=1 Tax=Elizabethkingia sp. YR214 TaxID=2135667 RepID=UPI000D312A1E|nr:outer membrane beta-barrel protein [Elizabethkingia sp. YR214]PUB34648.1 outer membrane protein with beta-barrel domain [Elizabethkingia sp. YR214]
MKDKWLIDLKNKIEGHEGNPPEGLWESIEKELFPDNTNDYHKHKVRLKLSYIINTIGIAATIALVISLIFFYEEKETTDNKTFEKHISNKSVEPDLLVQPVNEGIKKNMQDINYKVDNKDTPHIIDNKVINNQVIISLKKQSEGIKSTYNNDHQFNEVKKDGINKSEELVLTSIMKNKNEITSSVSGQLSGGDFVRIENDDLKSRPILDSKWTLNFTSRQTASNSSTQKGYTLMNGPLETLPNDGVEASGSPVSEILSENMNQDVNTNIKHRLPIRIGLSVSYQLNDKWSVTTGLTYTKLTSDLLSGTDANLIKSEQIIKYIGVPVQVNYNIWQKGNLAAYAGAGVQIEKSISGLMNTNYIVHHQTKESTSSKIRINSLQTSLNIGVGMQYKVYKNFGLYLEPGLRYYFNDGSDAKTLYKDRPLNMNLEFGVRYFIR